MGHSKANSSQQNHANPLIAAATSGPGKLPEYPLISPEHVMPAVQWLVSGTNGRMAAVEAALGAPGVKAWDEVMVPLEEVAATIHAVWSPVTHLFGVLNSPDLRKAYDEALPLMVDLDLKLGQNETVYRGLKSWQSDAGAWGKLSAAQRRIIEKRLLAAEHTGVALTGASRERFNEVEKELSQLATKFSNQLLDATKDFALNMSSKADVDGLPEHLLELAAHEYARRNKTQPNVKDGPWAITLDGPSFIPFMEFSKRPDLREKIYMASIKRASSGERDNSPLINQILVLRREKARLLGFNTYAALSLSSKMAPSVAEVRGLLEKLLNAALPAARRDLEDLKAFRKAHPALDGKRADGASTEALSHWDIAFWAERVKEAKYQYSEEELRPYFPLERVLDGLFALVKKAFRIDVRRAEGEAPVWHEDVRFFKVLDEGGKHIASFYLDPYSRPQNKKGGAWMAGCLDRWQSPAGLQIPVAHLVCNGTPPVGDTPGLMTFDQVRTLFHEFGHGLHHMLTEVPHIEAAGINNVEWDAVELPSQFMENWLFHVPTLKSLARHYQTGETLPGHYIQKILAARTYRSGSMIIRQLQFAFTDLELHEEFDPAGKETAFDVQNRHMTRAGVMAPHPENKFLCSFSHIFAGGYSAGYYSYKWAEVLSADAFAAFEEAGLENEATVANVGMKFRKVILAQGGSRHPMELFVEFRGRKPEPEALLRHEGLLSS
ncbi:M3 family peptidase [bacterium]|nr:M3 family peptidase [bacterium]